MDHLVLHQRRPNHQLSLLAWEDDHRRPPRSGVNHNHNDTIDANLLWRTETTSERIRWLWSALVQRQEQEGSTWNKASPSALQPGSSPQARRPVVPNRASSTRSSSNVGRMTFTNGVRVSSLRTRGWLRAVGWTVCVLLVVGALYQYIEQTRDEWLYPPPGRRFNINSHGTPHLLHLHCVGSGYPSVVLEAGLPYSSLAYELVLRQAVELGLTANMTFCSYDRSGYGWSDVNASPPNISSSVDELHRLLSAAGVSAPYVMVGWSYGGFIAELFAARFPNLVVGLVLIDSVLVNQTSVQPEFNAQLDEGILSFNIARMVQWIGAFRLAGYLGLLPQEAGAPSASLENPLRSVMLASITKYKFPTTAYHELSTFRDSEAILNQALSKKMMGGVKPLGKLPIVNLVAVDDSMPVEERQSWIEEQESNVSLLSSRHIQIEVESDHYVPLSAPQSVIRAVQECIAIASGNNTKYFRPQSKQPKVLLPQA